MTEARNHPRGMLQICRSLRKTPSCVRRWMQRMRKTFLEVCVWGGGVLTSLLFPSLWHPAWGWVLGTFYLPYPSRICDLKTSFPVSKPFRLHIIGHSCFKFVCDPCPRALGLSQGWRGCADMAKSWSSPSPSRLWGPRNACERRY